MESCIDTPNWSDAYGDGCDWYEANDIEGCPDTGNVIDWDGGMGTASVGCCFCGGGIDGPSATEPPTDAPTPPPNNNGCEDGSAMFQVDSEVGDANCAFLSVNYEQYHYLCQFLDVAAACPKTCDACEYFEEE